MKYLISILLFLLTFTAADARPKNEQIKKTTSLYAVKEADSLYLDRYDMHSDNKQKPCVMFMFGGGFTHGEREHENYAAYFERLASEGYVVVSIDYRLGIKKILENPQARNTIAQNGGMDPIKLLEAFTYTIEVAVEDLFDATNYVIKHSKEWNIDENTIIATGCSAGAIVVLQSEYEICNGSTLSKKLPIGFNYAGVVSFAGAIFSVNGDLKWPSKPAPLQLFHGDADKNVPYDKVELFNVGMYGSKHIAEQFDALKHPYTFYNIYNAAHEVANTPMREYLDEIVEFLDESVLRKLQIIKNIEIRDLTKPDRKKDFELMDYIKSNYAN